MVAMKGVNQGQVGGKENLTRQLQISIPDDDETELIQSSEEETKGELGSC